MQHDPENTEIPEIPEITVITPTAKLATQTHGGRAKCLQRLVRLELPVPQTVALSFDEVHAIAAGEMPFVSRGDNSGTHRAELRIWAAAGIDVDDPSTRTWYRKSGSGQGATLNIAASLDAFVLADAATWIAFDNKANLVAKGCRGESLRNVYGVLLGYDGEDVDGGGEGFARWLLGPGQAVIEDFEMRGQRPFVPVSQAGRDGSLPVVEALCGMATPDS